ncbi:MAG: recombinase family protein [Nitrospinae bacterium]|nr:recombinase family protein [Nitrospinota bacterium]
MEHTGRFVAYYRVSTAKQGQSGLGLDAQKKTVEDFLNGGNWTLEQSFVEIESGRKAGSNPYLNEALAYCRKHDCTLVIAKLDRLARNMAFVANLMESGVSFIAADNPHANKLTIHLMAAMGEFERDMISTRTKDALAAAKARGVVLGNPEIEKARKVAQDNANDYAEQHRRTFSDMKRRGLSQRAMADHLTAKGLTTPRGNPWSQAQVARTLKRLRM